MSDTPPSEKPASPWPGILFIPWCMVVSVAVLGGGSALWRRTVVVPDCIDVCEAAGSTFDHHRIRSRGGPPAACICRNERAIETSLDEIGSMLSAVVLLAACWAPFGLFARGDEPDARGPRGRPRSP